MNRHIAMASVMVLIAASGCAPRGPASSGPSSKPHPIRDVGDFRVFYDAPKNSPYAELQRALRESKLFDKIATDLNATLALPFDIPIHFDQCNELNAFYDPAERRITICYELISHVAREFAAHAESEEELEKATIGTALFVLYHEAGHGLVDVLKLPVTGKEEDAVDQLAVLVLVLSGEEEAALDGATWFLLQGALETDIENLAFWDEHSLDLQRFYNIACWVYGRDPGRHSDLVTEGILPEDRAQGCADEYQQLSGSWTTLLSPYLKK